ncbi:MAG: AAA family ATPase [Candidatus Woesearchaeota archaeon]
MDKQLMDFLLNSSSYEEKPRKVEFKQTHISNVFLTDNYVYKIKKPVNFGFLDFTTLKKRRFYCFEELRLNKRLSGDIYLGVVRIIKKDNFTKIDESKLMVDLDEDDQNFNENEEIIEYAVKMIRLPEDSLMSNYIKKDKLTKKHIKKISSILANFYKNAKTNDTINSYGSIENIKFITNQNFEQTEKYISSLFEMEKFNFIKSATNKFINSKKDLFNSRILNGKIKECHGDLHSGNIFINEKINIFDCIEFNEEFKNSDICCDIAFLSMDLDFNYKKDLSKYLISEFVDSTSDYLLYALLDFYKCYRAFVRAKVNAFMSDNPNLTNDEKNIYIENAKKYFHLAYRYACIFNDLKPTVLINCGFSGTGKSRWIKFASDMINSSILRTDSIRKKLLNIQPDTVKDEKYYQKYYSEEKRQLIYDYIYKKAKDILNHGGKVSIDATFIKKENRLSYKKLAEEFNAKFIIIHTVASSKIIKQRINERKEDENNLSDADFENAYQFQLNNFDDITKDEGLIIKINTEENEFQNLKILRNKLGEYLELEFKDIGY